MAYILEELPKTCHDCPAASSDKTSCEILPCRSEEIFETKCPCSDCIVKPFSDRCVGCDAWNDFLLILQDNGNDV